MKKLTLLVSAAALLGTGAAYAHNHRDGMNADANGDGVITRAEAQAKATERFAKMDANGDGVLNETDRSAGMEQRREQMFAKLDADGNGQISRAEFMSAEREGKRGGKRMGHRGHRGGKMMERADANNDGVIDSGEFVAGALTRFERADANNDGQVTQAERQAQRDQRRARWQSREEG